MILLIFVQMRLIASVATLMLEEYCASCVSPEVLLFSDRYNYLCKIMYLYLTFLSVIWKAMLT